MRGYAPLRTDDADEATVDAVDAGQNAIWAAMDAELSRIFNTKNAVVGDNTARIGTTLFAENPDDDADGDQEVIATLEAVIDALASKSAFEDAFGSGAIFDDSDGDNSFALSRDKGDVFNQVAYQADVEYRSTDYTRFGVWWRRDTANADVALARSGPAEDGTAFAYSFQKITNYGANAQDFPNGGRGRYEGRTVGFLSANGEQYEGDVALTVNWGAGPAATDDSTVRLELSNLEREDLGDPLVVHSGVGIAGGSGINTSTHSIKADSRDRLPAGQLATNPGTGQWLEVETIVLRNMKIANPSTEMSFEFRHGSGGSLASQLEFHDINGVVRNGNVMLSGHGTEASNYKLPTATVNGLFVGKSIDGPLGVLGTVELDNLVIDANADAGTAESPDTAGGRYLGHFGGTNDATDQSVTFVGGFGADLVR